MKTYTSMQMNIVIAGTFYKSEPMVQIADRSYAVPSKKWMLGMARQHAFHLGQWHNKFDCDDFAFSLKIEAQKLHKSGKGSVDGLALGVLFYKQDGSGGHAINFAISKGAVYFIEPQSGREVCLSKSELASVWFVYL